jgi:hypothetical protein
MQYGVIQKIFYIEQPKSYLSKIQPLDNITYDSLKIVSQVFANGHVIFGSLSKHKVHLISAENIIEKACFYETNEICYFGRYPYPYESS